MGIRHYDYNGKPSLVNVKKCIDIVKAQNLGIVKEKEMIRNMIEIFTEVMKNVGDTELNNQVKYNATMKWI